MPRTSESCSVWAVFWFFVLSLALGCRARETPKIEPVKREFVAPKPSVDPVEEELRKSLKSDEHLVYVDYKFPSFAELEKEFGKGRVAELFHEGPWKKSGITRGIPEVPGPHVVRVVGTGHDQTSYGELVKEMDSQGYYPATHLIAYAFQKKYPELLEGKIYSAIGDAIEWRAHLYVMTMDAKDGKRWLGADYFGDIGLFPFERYLFLRKDSTLAK